MTLYYPAYLQDDGAIIMPVASPTAGVSAAAAAGQSFYVSTTGSDSGDGSAGNPFRTINRAIQEAGAGDEVVVKAGTYNESLNINQGGSDAGYLTITSETPGGALIRPPASAWNAISVNANYVTIDGFDIQGRDGDGIEANNVHHINILNNVVHDAGESGIQFNWSEFITIEGNETYNNASSGWFSGISIYQVRNITGDTTTTGFRTIVRNNISHDNVTTSGQHTDGNGIIIDDFQSTQTGGFPNYTFPTLVENNLVYENGGKGVQVTWSDYVTVRNNTAWHNNQDNQNTGTWRGELSNSMSSHNTWVNNIAVADPSINSNNTAIDNTSYGGYVNNVIWANNLTSNGTAGQASVRTDGGNAMLTLANGNLLGVNPGFVGAPGDFSLGANSASVDAGTASHGLSIFDLNGDDRTYGTVDLGAYETSPLTDPLPQVGTAGNDTLTGTTGNDNISGLAGDDQLAGGFANDNLFGGVGADRLVGGIGNDKLYGGDGDDRLRGGAENDLFDGGDGIDRAVFTSNVDATVNLSLITAQLTGYGTDTLVNVENVSSGSGNDSLTGNGLGNKLASGGGSDQLSGAGGNDTLFGGDGSDTLNGGTGDDRLTGGAGADAFEFRASGGADMVKDFQDDVDTIWFDAALWGGGSMTAASIIASNATIVGGDAVFTFGGHVLTINGVTNLDDLLNDISVL